MAVMGRRRVLSYRGEKWQEKAQEKRQNGRARFGRGYRLGHHDRRRRDATPTDSFRRASRGNMDKRQRPGRLSLAPHAGVLACFPVPCPGVVVARNLVLVPACMSTVDLRVSVGLRLSCRSPSALCGLCFQRHDALVSSGFLWEREIPGAHYLGQQPTCCCATQPHPRSPSPKLSARGPTATGQAAFPSATHWPSADSIHRNLPAVRRASPRYSLLVYRRPPPREQPWTNTISSHFYSLSGTNTPVPLLIITTFW